MPGHTFLYSPPVNKVRDLIESGDLGEIYFVSTSRVNLGLHQPDVSVVWDLGPHDLSILRYWLGETPGHVAATSRGCVMPGTPDVAFIHLSIDSGRSRTSSSPGSHRASFAGRPSSAPQDGRLRRHQHRAGAGLRLGRRSRRPRELRRVPAELPHRRHRLAARRRGRAAVARAPRFLQGDPDRRHADLVGRGSGWTSSALSRRSTNRSQTAACRSPSNCCGSLQPDGSRAGHRRRRLHRITSRRRPPGAWRRRTCARQLLDRRPTQPAPRGPAHRDRRG